MLLNWRDDSFLDSLTDTPAQQGAQNCCKGKKLIPFRIISISI